MVLSSMLEPETVTLAISLGENHAEQIFILCPLQEMELTTFVVGGFPFLSTFPEYSIIREAHNG
jgi:hypothetical protein